MEQKQLRNEDSIEMLALINANRQFDIAMGFRWTNDFVTAINSAVLNGTGGAASITASHKSAIEAKIAATLEALGE